MLKLCRNVYPTVGPARAGKARATPAITTMPQDKSCDYDQDGLRCSHPGGPHSQRPAEPATQHCRYRRRHKRPHHQRVEQQAQPDCGAALPDYDQVAGHHRRHCDGEDEASAVTTPPVAPMALMIPVLMPAPISSLNRDTT